MSHENISNQPLSTNIENLDISQSMKTKSCNTNLIRSIQLVPAKTWKCEALVIWKWIYQPLSLPADTQHRFNIFTILPTSYRRLIDVETKLCVYWAVTWTYNKKTPHIFLYHNKDWSSTNFTSIIKQIELNWLTSITPEIIRKDIVIVFW